MRIVCIGGGPAGLYFGLLMKRQDPTHEVSVIERNRPYDTFGWGVVFSDQTLGNLRAADAPSADAILGAFNHWDDIEVNFRGATVRSSGHGFCGIGRKHLLNILQGRCEALGVELVFETDVTALDTYTDSADLVVACDGANSSIRRQFAATYQPDIALGNCRFVWLGTTKLFGAFTFAFEQTEWGWFQAHAYRFDDTMSTFIVEAPEHVWRAAGLEQMDKDSSIAFCERLFARYLDGHRLISNAGHLRGSAQWLRFPRVVNQEWVHWQPRTGCGTSGAASGGDLGGSSPAGSSAKRGSATPVVLMGDAAHTAHFSIGSGTRLAFEDAIELAASLAAHPGELDTALRRYTDERRIGVLRIQNAARNSTEWFEHVERYAGFAPEQFAYSLLTRSQRISHENLRERDADYVAHFENWLGERAGLPAAAERRPVPPMFTPFTVRGVALKNRVVVSPMAQYCAVDGVVGDHHLVHLGARALGGAALVMAEMTCVTADGRITPGCPGLYNDQQRDAWRRIADFVHAGSDAKLGMQLGHAGAKASTRVAWEGIDQPLLEGNWPIVSASPQQYVAGLSQWSRAASSADLAEIREAFARAARRAAQAGFDWLELHCAHGYLLSSFLSPLTNHRTDEYGGTLENRLRYPLEVFAAVRAAWPQAKPISVRISAHDWVDGGTTPDDAVQIARAFKTAGADLIDVSSGQVSKHEKPIYGRMFQTPFADRVRNEAGIATIAVGAISEADHVNSIIAAGRADLCAIARPHLANPAWTLDEAAKLGYAGVAWPRQYQAGKTQLERSRQREREQAQRPGQQPLQLAAQDSAQASSPPLNAPAQNTPAVPDPAHPSYAAQPGAQASPAGLTAHQPEDAS